MKTVAIAVLSAAVLGATLFAAAPSQAQSTTCANRMVIDTVFQRSGGPGYEYFFHLRNATGAPLKGTVDISNFPSNVSLFSKNLPNIDVGSWANKEIKFGNGTNNQIHMGMLSIVYDGQSPSTQYYLRVSNCH